VYVICFWQKLKSKCTAAEPLLLLSVCDSQTAQYHFQNTILMLYGSQQIVIYANVLGNSKSKD